MPWFTLNLTYIGEFFPIIDPNTRLLISAIVVFLIFLTFIPGLIAYFIFKVIGISGFRRIFSYEGRDSLVHDMHPLTKILFTLFISVGVAVAEQLYTLLFLFALTLILWYYSNPSSDRLRLVTILLLTQWLLIGWGQSFLNPRFTSLYLNRIYTFPDPIRAFMGITAITLEGFQYGLFQGVRVVTAMSAAILLISTTHPSQILYGLKYFKFPIEINFMIAIVLRSIPEILSKSTLVLAAERARGLRIVPRATPNIFSLIRDSIRAFGVVILAFIPIIIESIRAGRQLALAASVKAFRAYKDRTYYNVIPLRGRDKTLAVILGLSIVFLAIYPFLTFRFAFLPAL